MKLLDHLEEWLIALLMGAATLFAATFLAGGGPLASHRAQSVADRMPKRWSGPCVVGPAEECLVARTGFDRAVQGRSVVHPRRLRTRPGRGRASISTQRQGWSGQTFGARRGTRLHERLHPHRSRPGRFRSLGVVVLEALHASSWSTIARGALGLALVWAWLVILLGLAPA